MDCECKKCCKNIKIKIKPEPTCFGEKCTTECNEFLAVFYPKTTLPDGAIILETKGVGQLLRQIPTPGNPSGGNCRGINAVDWQNLRTIAENVASGETAVLSGGIDNRASGNQSAVGGGDKNYATGRGSTIPGGCTNTASGEGSLASCIENIASGKTSVAFGLLNEAQGDFSGTLSGSQDVTNGLGSVVAGGLHSYAGGNYSGVFSGLLNNCNANYSAILSGNTNNIESPYANIGGGHNINIFSGANYGVIPGGLSLSLPLGTNVNNYAQFTCGQYNNSGSLTAPYPIFTIGNGNNGNPSNALMVDHRGDLYIEGAYSHGGPTVQIEYMESIDKTGIPIGTSVIIQDGKIRPSGDQIPDGVISIKQGIIGNSAHQFWHKMYLRDEVGNIIYEDRDIKIDKTEKIKKLTQALQEVEKVDNDCQKKVLDKLKEVITDEINKPSEVIRLNVPKINPDYNPELRYVPRSQRPEWHPVCFFGRCKVLKGQKVHPNWKKLGETEKYYEYLIR